MLFILYNVVMVPISIAYNTASLGEDIVNGLGDTVFLMDIVLSFRTGSVRALCMSANLFSHVHLHADRNTRHTTYAQDTL